MKRFGRIGMMLLMTGLVVPALFFSGCKDDPSQEELFLKKVAGTWILSSTGASVDAVEVNNVFAGFTLKIDEAGGYTTSNGNPPIWAAKGTFKLEKSSNVAGFNLKRDDGVLIELEQPSDTILILHFIYTAKPARQNSVSGQYTFDLVRKP